PAAVRVGRAGTVTRARETGILSYSGCNAARCDEMKPAPFDYVAPRSLDEAIDALAAGGPDAKLLAGGQSLIPLLNFRLAHPTLLVDLNHVGELAYVESRDRGTGIGAMTRQATVERDAELAVTQPLLVEA